MLTKAGAKLLDFGLARPGSGRGGASGSTALPTEAKPLTSVGTVLGTFQYKAPEQLEGAEADPRTDIFALGALLEEVEGVGKARARLLSGRGAGHGEQHGSEARDTRIPHGFCRAFARAQTR